MIQFETDTCPLCGRKLEYSVIAGADVYQCPSAVIFSDTSTIGHYEVICDSHNAMQHMYVSPYSIDTDGTTGTSRVYKWVPDDDNFWGWQLLFSAAQIKADTFEKLLERLQRLVTFL